MEQRSFKTTRELFAEVEVRKIRVALSELKRDLKTSRSELKRTVGHKYEDLLLSSDQVVAARCNIVRVNEILEEVPLQCCTTLAPFSRPVPGEESTLESDKLEGGNLPTPTSEDDTSGQHNSIRVVVQTPELIARQLSARDPEGAARAFMKARCTFQACLSNSIKREADFVRRQWRSTEVLESSILSRARTLLRIGNKDAPGEDFSPARSRAVCASAARALILLDRDIDSRRALDMMLKGRDAILGEFVTRSFLPLCSTPNLELTCNDIGSLLGEAMRQNGK